MALPSANPVRSTASEYVPETPRMDSPLVEARTDGVGSLMKQASTEINSIKRTPLDQRAFPTDHVLRRESTAPIADRALDELSSSIIWASGIERYAGSDNLSGVNICLSGGGSRLTQLMRRLDELLHISTEDASVQEFSEKIGACADNIAAFFDKVSETRRESGAKKKELEEEGKRHLEEAAQGVLVYFTDSSLNGASIA